MEPLSVSARLFEALHAYTAFRKSHAEAEQLGREVLGDRYPSLHDEHAWLPLPLFLELARRVKQALGDEAVVEALATMVPRRRDYSVASLSAMSLSPAFLYRHVDRARSFFASHLRYEILDVQPGRARLRHIGQIDGESAEDAQISAEVTRGMLMGVTGLFGLAPAEVVMTKSSDAPHTWEVEVRWRELPKHDLAGLVVGGLVAGLGNLFLPAFGWVLAPVLGYGLGREIRHHHFRRHMVLVSEEQRRALGENERDFERRYAELMTLHEELEERVAERTEELREAMVRLARRNTDLAHELRGPMASIVGNIEMILERTDEKSGDSSLSNVKDLEAMTREIDLAAQTMTDVVQWFVDASRGAEAAFAPLDLKAETERALRLVRRRFLKRIDVQLELGESVEVGAYGHQLTQVLVNLILNASHALDGQGRLWVRVLRRGEEVLVEVEDDGPGMSEAILGRIFERGFTTKSGLGLGLGLPLCREIITRHRGEIEMVSELGRGTTARVRLPVWKKERPSQEPRSQDPTLAQT